MNHRTVEDMVSRFGLLEQPHASRTGLMKRPWWLPAQPEGRRPYPCLLWLLLLGKSSTSGSGRLTLSKSPVARLQWSLRE